MKRLFLIACDYERNEVLEEVALTSSSSNVSNNDSVTIAKHSNNQPFNSS